MLQWYDLFAATVYYPTSSNYLCHLHLLMATVFLLKIGQAFFTTTFSSNNNLPNGQCNFHNLCTWSLVLTITTLYPTLSHYFLIIWYFIFRCLEWQKACTETSKWGGSWAWWDLPRTGSSRLYQHSGFWSTLSDHLANTWACGQFICTCQERHL